MSGRWRPDWLYPTPELLEELAGILLKQEEEELEVRPTQDGEAIVYWMAASDDGNLDAGWVIHYEGEEYPSLCENYAPKEAAE